MKLHLAREDQITTADGQLVVLDVLASQGLVKVLRKGTLTEKFLPIADIRTGMSSGEISINQPEPYLIPLTSEMKEEIKDGSIENIVVVDTKSVVDLQKIDEYKTVIFLISQNISVG